MELELPSIWPVILTILGTVLPIVFAMFIFATSGTKKTKRILWITLLVVFVGSVVFGVVGKNISDADLNAKFSNQLAEKYGATSNRSYVDMSDKLYDSGEVSTTLTRDGVETDVFIKRVYNGKRDKVELLFTVFDKGSLYPEVKSAG